MATIRREIIALLSAIDEHEAQRELIAEFGTSRICEPREQGQS